MRTYSPTYNHISCPTNAITLQPTTRRLPTSYPSFHLGGHFGLLEWMHYKLTIAPNIITPNSHYITTLHDILFCNCSESETTEVTYYLLSRNGRIRDSIRSQQLHKNNEGTTITISTISLNMSLFVGTITSWNNTF